MGNGRQFNYFSIQQFDSGSKNPLDLNDILVILMVNNFNKEGRKIGRKSKKSIGK